MPHYLKSRDIKKTRVKHHCCKCNRTINIGESCIESSHIYDGHIYSAYNCDVCQAYERHLDKTLSKEEREDEVYSNEFLYTDITGYDEFAATYVIESILSE